MSAWERGPREGPLLSFAGPFGAPRRQTGRQAPSGVRRPFRVRGLLRGLRGSPAASCMPPTRVARFRRVGVLRGASGSMPLAFDAFALLLAQPLPLPCFGGQTSERGL